MDIDVVVFGILNQPPQEIERGVGRTDRYLPIDGAKTVGSDNSIGRAQSGVDHDGPVNADFPIMNVEARERLGAPHVVVQIEAHRPSCNVPG